MRVMDELTESHRRMMPAFHHAGAQSPRVGGCVGAFFNMFDWNPSKRFTATKRITADRPNSEAHYGRRDGSFTERGTNTTTLPQPLLINEGKDEAFATGRSTPTLSATPSPASVTSKRVPGVVARLMGLESLPDGTHPSSRSEPQDLHSEQLDSPPVLLQELLRQEFQHSRKKLPGFTKRAQDSKPARGPSVSQRKKPAGHFGEHAHPYGDSRASRPARPGEKKAASLLASNSTSPLLSPPILGGKTTVAAVKSLEPGMQPSPRSRHCLSRDSQSDTGASFRRVTPSSHGRAGSLSSSSSRSSRSQTISSGETTSPGSRSSRSTRHDSCKQDQASRRRFETALVASAKPPSPRAQKKADGSPRGVLGTHEASIRGFKINLEKDHEDQCSAESKLPLTPPRSDGVMEPPGPRSRDQNADTSHGSPSTVSGGGGFRFRNRGGKQERDVGGQAGNRVVPSDKHPVSPPLTKDGAGFSYSMMLFRKQGDKKEGTHKGEALAMKRTDSALMRSLLRRPGATTKSVSQCNVKKTTKSSTLGKGLDKLEPAKAEEDCSEEASSPAQKQCDDGPVHVQARCRSIDDVFPELPMEESHGGGSSPKTFMEEQFSGVDSSLVDCRSIERMFGKGLSTSPDFASFDTAALQSPVSPEVFVTECGSVPGTFPNSPLVKYEKIFFSSRHHLNLQDMFEVVSGDRPEDGRPQERVSDDEDAAADLDTCSTSAVCDTGGTPERLEIQKMSVDPGWSEDVMMMTPPALKKFEEKLAQGSLCADDLCGQPSPVSVLENPFLDEGPTTPDASLAGSQEADGEGNDMGETEPSPRGDEEQPQKVKKDKVASLEMVETEKIKQAILDISRIRNIDVTSIGLELPTVDPQQEKSYVREVLDAANLLREGESSWYSAESPMEFGSTKLVIESLPDARRQGSSVRSERRLLFDSIKEVMALEPWMRTSSFHMDLPMFPDLHSRSKFRSPMSGEPLVEEVYRMICHWRDIAGNVLDDLIDYDLNVPEGQWVDFTHAVADIGLDIERMLMKDLLEEFADDLASISKIRRK